MGNCINRGTKNNADNQAKKDERAPPKNFISEIIDDKEYTIQITNGSVSTIKFNHSPLTHSEYLHQKFLHTANRPEEVNLSFMLLGIQILEQTQTVRVKFMHQNQVTIYFILGGEEGISSTGLLIDICNVKFVQKFNRKKGSPEGVSIDVTPPKLNGEDITIVIEPNLKKSQSMYLNNQFSYDSKKKKYGKRSSSLQWSSLAFNLLDIYGAETEFRMDKMQECSVCLTNPANVILTPCRHMCMCNTCSKKYQQIQRRCPICRAQFRSFIEYM